MLRGGRFTSIDGDAGILGEAEFGDMESRVKAGVVSFEPLLDIDVERGGESRGGST